MGVVTSPAGELLAGKTENSVLHGEKGLKLKNPNPEGLLLHFGDSFEESTLFNFFTDACISEDSQLSNCPMKLKLGEIMERRVLTYS